MKLIKTKLSALVVLSAFMLPTVVGAATPPTTVISTPLFPDSSISQTNVNGTLVPGIYITNKDSRIAYIPGGVGLVVVDKAIALPLGAYYIN